MKFIVELWNRFITGKPTDDLTVEQRVARLELWVLVLVLLCSDTSPEVRAFFKCMVDTALGIAYAAGLHGMGK